MRVIANKKYSDDEIREAIRLRNTKMKWSDVENATGMQNPAALIRGRGMDHLITFRPQDRNAAAKKRADVTKNRNHQRRMAEKRSRYERFCKVFQKTTFKNVDKICREVGINRLEYTEFYLRFKGSL